MHEVWKLQQSIDRSSPVAQQAQSNKQVCRNRSKEAPWMVARDEQRNMYTTPLVRVDQLSQMSSVREKVKTPATVSQAETAADQHMCSGVIPLYHPGSGFG